MTCELCALAVEPIWRGDKLSVIAVDDANYPGFCRVVWNAHVKEMTDLASSERALMMDAVWKVEEAVREVMEPQKVNLASLGNMTPHLHWHVIPRYADDAQWPSPVWAAAAREVNPAALELRRARLPRLAAAIRSRMEQA